MEGEKKKKKIICHLVILWKQKITSGQWKNMFGSRRLFVFLPFQIFIKTHPILVIVYTTFFLFWFNLFSEMYLSYIVVLFGIYSFPTFFLMLLSLLFLYFLLLC